MNIDNLINHTSEWLKGTGEYSDIVISSRIRLARNLEKIPFSHWAKDEEKKEVLDITSKAITSQEQMKDSLFVEMDKVSNIDKQLLTERHLVSMEHIKDGFAKAAVINKNETISIMINEEDHLRIQAIKSGFNLQQAWNNINVLDRNIADIIDYAFSDRWGYLTACPTNTGTGMRASVMLHLPGLVMANQINKILDAVSKLSLAVRGFYGEGSQATGNFFQISNQVTLGNSEGEIIDSLARVIRQIIDQENQIRLGILNNKKINLEDKIWRAYGILSNAKIISSSETIDLLSSLRLGVSLGIIDNIDRKLINELFITIQPAHLQKKAGNKLDSAERDEKRAELIKQKLGL